ncbi:MAG TPA: hypothetical protein VGC13_03150 [Longimicrobium sp.]|jgi:hypothetical protein|uniref:hypothetical protein n=1 Tax=Longimicrobium sp. TaxID=2029185 RepID=UPI002ED9ECB4
MDEAALVSFARRCLEPVLGESPEGCFLLAGGTFKSLLHGRPPRDLDLWPSTPADRERLAAQLVRRGALLLKDHPPYQTSYTFPGQLVELAHDTSVAGLADWLQRCDLALSAIGVEHRDGRWRGAIHPQAIESIRRREVLLLTPLVNWKYALATLERLRRYAEELGFGVPREAEQATWRVFDGQTRAEQNHMIARYLRVCPGDERILDEARRRSGSE